MANKIFSGAGGPDKPNVVDDNLLSEDVLEFALAVSEGPIRGLTEGAKSFNVGDTALVNKAGMRNFDKFAIGVHPGYPEGSARPLELKLGGVTSNTQVGVQLVQYVPVVRQALGALRGTTDQLEVRMLVNRLVKLSAEGDAENNTAQFTLEYKPSEAVDWLPFVNGNPVVTVTGKTSSGYSKEFRVDVPRLPNDDWQVRVVKMSVDDDLYDIVELTFESFQSTNKTQLTYPNTAIVHGLGVANGQFASIPEFSGIYDGLVIRVPTNYNADLRTYDDTTPWDGSFKFSWTNNPAWILYDLITNTRYGLAKHRRYVDANRFTFYEAARWCDTPVLVPGDVPSYRPRYTFNDVITDPRPGMEMLGYVAGSFNALVWDDLAGQIHLRVDKDDPAEQVFTPENIGDDGFQYTFTDITTRANDLSVSFVNPELDWAEDRRRIPNVTTNETDIAKFGRIPLDFIAVGCTNVHEAVAKAQVRLISALTETTMVSFTAPRQGALLSLFSVILIADPVMGWSVSGRISSYDDEFINFRDAIFIESIKNYTVKVQTPTGLIEVTVEPEETGHVTRLKLVNSTLPPNLQRLPVFTLEEEGGFGFGKPFRVLGLEEVEGSPYMYRVQAMEINRNKYLLSESGTPITEPQYSYQQPFLPGQPAHFNAVSGDDTILVMPTGEVIARILCTWRKPFGSVVTGYELQFKMTSDEAWQSIKTPQNEMYISPAVAGKTYALRVASFDPAGNRSAWAVINNYLVKSKTIIPKALVSLTATPGLFQNEVSWVFSDNKDIKKTEIRASNTNNVLNANVLADLSHPTNHYTHVGLDVAKLIYYWARVQDTSGNWSPLIGPASATTISDPSVIKKILDNSITELELYEDLRDRIDLIDADGTGLVDKVTALTAAFGSTESAAASAVTAAEAAAAASAAEANAIIAQASAADSASAASSSKTAAQVANTAAQTAASASQTNATTANTAATAAGAAATVAVNERIAAQAANTAAGTSATAAQTSATQASGSATAAGGSATAANTSKLAAEAANTAAGTAANAAVAAKDTATASATAAGSSATSSQTSATSAATSAGSASTSATNASTSATNALGSANSASTSAGLAATAKNGAEAASSAAAGSATTATAQATSATTSASTASTARIAAESARDAALGSAQAAATSASTATTQATAAGTSASSATGSANTASTKAGEALSYRNAAAQSATDANGYAIASAQNYTAVYARLDNIGGVTLEQAMTATAGSITGLKAQYSVKIDNNGHVTGFGLSSEPINGATVSAFVINADRFAIVIPGAAANATPTIPFVVGLINGQSTVGITGTLVVDGTISARALATDFIMVGGTVGDYHTEVDKKGMRVYNPNGSIRVRVGIW